MFKPVLCFQACTILPMKTSFRGCALRYLSVLRTTSRHQKSLYAQSKCSGDSSPRFPSREPSPLSLAEQDHLRKAPAPYAKADIAAMTPREREALRLKSRALPLVASNEPLDIVFEDDVFLVVSKPSWLKMHPIHRFQGGTLLNRVIGYLGYNPYTCHRLDMHTSGVVMFLKDKSACASTATAFQTGNVHKQYLCIVDKNVGEPDSFFEVNAPIERHDTVAVARQIGNTGPTSKEALTDFEVMSSPTESDMAILKASPKTGRTHQIRLHARHAGYPIVGDDVYGRERACYESMDHVRACAGDPSMALFADNNILRAGLKLHAWQITLEHPFTKEEVHFCAPPPVRFDELAESEKLVVPDSPPSRGA